MLFLSVLPIGRVYKAQNIKCQYCGFVNSYEPGRKRLLEQRVLENIINQECFDKWILKYQLENKLNSLIKEKVTLELLQKLEKAERDYWESFYGKRADKFEHEKKFLESNVKSKMDILYRSFKAYEVWIEYK